MKNFFKKVIKSFLVIFYHCLLYLPINRKVILFESSLGRNYTGNPKYIYEEMVRKGLDKKYRCVWILENPNTTIPGNCKKIKRSRLQYLYYMAIAHFWIFDCRQPSFLVKREGCVYIQTWHGTPLKKLALDMEVLNMGGEVDLEEYKKTFYKNTRRWDILLSQNRYSTEIFKRAFAFHKTILEIGYPRNDILFCGNDKNIIDKIKDKLNLPKDKKIILYAPTWRDDEYYEKGRYKFSKSIDLNYLMNELMDGYVLLLKGHYLVVDNLDLDKYKGFVFSFSHEQDIQELYLVSDILITDYSSVMFDYSILRRPMIFFTYDIENYRKNIRGFYFNLENEAPGPLVYDNQSLVKVIKNIESDFHKYLKLYDKFQLKYNQYDNGTAASQIIKLIEDKYKGV